MPVDPEVIEDAVDGDARLNDGDARLNDGDACLNDPNQRNGGEGSSSARGRLNAETGAAYRSYRTTAQLNDHSENAQPEQPTNA